MGDLRYSPHYARVRDAEDRMGAIRSLSDGEVVAALAAASSSGDPYISNVLATEASNRMQRNAVITRALTEGILFIGPDLRLLQTNPAAEKLLVAQRGELLGTHIHDIVHCADEDSTCQGASVCDVMPPPTTRGPDVIRHATFACLDGTRLPASYTLAPVLNGGESEGAVIAFRDESRTRPHREGGSAERQIVRAFLDGVAIANAAGVITYANRAYARVHGAESENELLEHSWRAFYPDESRRRLDSEVADTLNAQSSWRGEITARRIDGSTFPAEVSIQRYAGGTAHVIRDVSAQAVAKRDLVNREEQARSLFRFHPEAVFSVDPAGRILAANELASELTGYPHALLRSAPLASIVDPEDSAKLSRALEAALTARRSECAARLVTREGNRIASTLKFVPSVAGNTVAGAFVIASRVATPPLADRMLPYETPPLAPDEEARLAALRASTLGSESSQRVLDDITRVAAHIFATPIALVTAIDTDTQWIVGRTGVSIASTTRDVSFCGHAILKPRSVMHVEDASKDARFAGNPLVTGEPHIRSYTGAPIQTADGHALGSVCVMDRVPRSLTHEQTKILKALARIASAQVAPRPEAGSTDIPV